MHDCNNIYLCVARSPTHNMQLRRRGTREYVLGSIIQEVKLMVLQEAKARELQEYELQREQALRRKKEVCALELCTRMCTTRRFVTVTCHVIPTQQRSHITPICAHRALMRSLAR